LTNQFAFRNSHSAIRLPPIDRTYKLFIGGKQSRPDQGYSRKILGPDGRVVGEVAEGNRKDVRNAVEAAHAAEAWGRGSGHMRGQILYFIAENLATRADEFAARVGRQEVDASIAGCSPMPPGPTSGMAPCTTRQFAA